MSDVDSPMAFLRGEVDAEHYWREHGEQKISSAGVRLTPDQKARVLKQLTRLAQGLRDIKFEGEHWQMGALDVEALQQLFERHLATYR